MCWYLRRPSQPYVIVPLKENRHLPGYSGFSSKAVRLSLRNFRFTPSRQARTLQNSPKLTCTYLSTLSHQQTIAPLREQRKHNAETVSKSCPFQNYTYKSPSKQTKLRTVVSISCDATNSFHIFKKHSCDATNRFIFSKSTKAPQSYPQFSHHCLVIVHDQTSSRA